MRGGEILEKLREPAIECLVQPLSGASQWLSKAVWLTNP